jgi:hypothetical protein
MKFSFLFIFALAGLLRKCAQEGIEQGTKVSGRKAIEQSSKNVVRNSDVVLANISAKTILYYNVNLNKENKNVSYIDSTNTFIITNEE